MAYNTQNVFAKIVRGEMPCQVVYEDEEFLAFHDLYKAAPIHILLIPKAPYESFDDFARYAEQASIAKFFQIAQQIAQQEQGLVGGYRLVMNTGHNAGQTVPHFHLHIIGGAKLLEPVSIEEKK